MFAARCDCVNFLTMSGVLESGPWWRQRQNRTHDHVFANSRRRIGCDNYVKNAWVCCPGCWMTLASGFAAPSTPRVSFVRVESGVDPLALRDARLRMGLTQHELARLIDVAGGERISRWELGSSQRGRIRHR